VFLTPRQQLILKAVVEDYISTAEPVGSRALSKKFPLGVSPATLRNEMADLEEEGLLRQPHTSAGRIPSDAGYRLFVDLLMERGHNLLPEEELRVLEKFQAQARDVQDILQQTAKVTAVLAHCTAIVRAPRLHRSRIQFIQMLPLSDQDTMLVILTDQGTTLNQLVHLPSVVTADELALLSNFLNAQLRGQPLDQLTGKVLDRLLAEMRGYEQVLRALWQRLYEVHEPSERVYVSNASILAQQPEFGESGKIRGLLCLLEREQTLANLLSLLHAEGVDASQVSIGRENPLADLHECSVVSATYAIGDRVIGEIGVLGPTRLEYPRAVAAVETMARYLSTTLTRFFGYRV
jgi:heat-inducible transcriptional repressor